MDLLQHMTLNLVINVVTTAINATTWVDANTNRTTVIITMTTTTSTITAATATATATTTSSSKRYRYNETYLASQTGPDHSQTPHIAGTIFL